MIREWWAAFKGEKHKDDNHSSDRMGFFANQGTARFTSTFVWIARVSFLALLVTLIFLGLLFYWSVKSYDLFEIQEAGRIHAPEMTSNGVPVIREGEFVTYDVLFRNEGINTLAEREAIIHGNLQTGIVSPPIAGFELARVKFFTTEPVERETIIEIGLPANLPKNSYYSIKTVTSYEPNPIRTVESVSETEVFLYLENGIELP